jgi:hypothetical protein
VEGQLRDAYAKRNESGEVNQVGLAKMIGVSRSAISKILGGRRNLTLRTIADIVWALGYAIRVIIYDPNETVEPKGFTVDVPKSKTVGPLTRVSSNAQSVELEPCP